MTTIHHTPQQNMTRRELLVAGAFLGYATVLAACGRSKPATESSITLEAFPAGLGRGFPQAQRVSGNGNTGIRAGDLPPNFRLTLTNGQGLTLHDLVGRPVMLNFWATWCGPCRIEMPDIIRQAGVHSELVVIAVNVREELAAVQTFAADFRMTTPVALDVSGDISDLYEIVGMPTSFFVGRDGRIAAVWTGLLSPDKLQEMLGTVI